MTRPITRRPPSQLDRTFTFVRAAYIWLLFSSAMMPFFPLYGVLTHQVFAHTYMGSHRHAFTVGFISLMIIGVSSRVVPILAGMDARRMNSLWAPFILTVGPANNAKGETRRRKDCQPN